MTKYLITPTLLNSFKYYQNDQWKEPAESRLDFLKTLSRERFAPNEAMQKGIDFENDINAICNGDITNTDNFKEPHFGIVKVGKDVEIGANTSVDRALFGETVLGDGVKIVTEAEEKSKSKLRKTCDL